MGMIPGTTTHNDGAEMTSARFRVFAACFLALMALRAAPAVAAEPVKVDVGHFKILDVHGQTHHLDANEFRSGTAFVFLSTECPISRQYVPELNRLEKVAAAAGKIAFYGILSDSTVTRRQAVKFVDEFKIGFPVLFDASAELAGLFQPDHVPEAFLIDAAGAIVYRGRIDDLYADIDKRRVEPTRKDLLDAMQALAEKRPIDHPRTEAVGCPFEKGPAADANSKVTYARHRAPAVCALRRVSSAGRSSSIFVAHPSGCRQARPRRSPVWPASG